MEYTVSLAVSNECIMVIAALSCIHFYLLLLTPVLSLTFVRAPGSIPRHQQQGAVSCYSVLYQT